MPQVAGVAIPQDTTFWVSESPNSKAFIVVHANWCRSCKDGRGVERLRPSTDRALRVRWHGPFQDDTEAMMIARQLGEISSGTPRLCGHCLDVNPNARRRIRPFLPSDATFLVRSATDGSVSVHTSLCPVFLNDTLTAPPSRDERCMASGK